MGKSSLDIMLDVLGAMRGSPATMDRLALASTVSHGERSWVSEAAFHARDRGVPTAQETSVGAARRVDLRVGGTAVEFKSTHGAWALTRSDAERDLWFQPDITKLRAAGVPALMVITVASLTRDVEHQRSTPGYKYEPARAQGNDPSGVLLAGMTAASRFLAAAECSQVQEVTLGTGHVPGSGGEVLLGAVVGVVNADDRVNPELSPPSKEAARHMHGSTEPSADEAEQNGAFVVGYLTRPSLDDDIEIAALVAEHLSSLRQVLRDRLGTTQAELGEFELNLHFTLRSARVQGRDDDVHVDFY